MDEEFEDIKAPTEVQARIYGSYANFAPLRGTVTGSRDAVCAYMKSLEPFGSSSLANGEYRLVLPFLKEE